MRHIHYQQIKCYLNEMVIYYVEVDCNSKRQLCGGTQAAVECMLQFGRELHAMSEQLRRDHGSNPANKKALRVRIHL